MKKSLLGLALAMAMAAGNAWANDPASGQHKGHTGAMGQKNEIMGTVESVDPAKNQIVLKSMGSVEPTTLLIDKNTKIMLDGQTASLSELKEGQEVRASFDLKRGAKKAVKIEATRAAAGAVQGMNELRGTVQAVRPAQNELVLEPAKSPEASAPTTLRVDHDTTIFIDGRTGSLSDLKPGQEVRASFDMKGNERHANWIEVTTAASPDMQKQPAPSEPTQPAPSNPDQPY